jgi:hypothetical protein
MEKDLNPKIRNIAPAAFLLSSLLLGGFLLPTACSKSAPTAPPTPTFTFTPTPTNWAGYTSTYTFTSTPTGTSTSTATTTPTNQNGYTSTPNSQTPTPSPTNTISYQPPNTGTPTNTFTFTNTNTFTPTVSSPTPILTVIPTQTVGIWSVEAPNALAQASNGNVYVAFGDAASVPAVPGGVVEFNSSGVSQMTFPGYPGSQANGIAIDGNGNIYVADQNGSVYAYNSSGVSQATLTTWTAADGGPGAFNQPEGLAVDANNNLYVADSGNGWVEVFPPYSTWNTPAATTEWNQLSGAGVTFSIPSAVAVDPSSGTIFVADAGTGLVNLFTSLSSPPVTYSSQWPTYADSDIWGLSFSGGNVYVADTYNGMIEVYSESGNVLDYWSGPTNLTFPPGPDGVIVALNGDVLVTDFSNNQVESFGP